MRDGTRVSQEYVLNDHYFVPGYCLLSLDHARRDYRSLLGGGDDYYGVDGAGSGRVIHHPRESPRYRTKYSSMTTMMKSVAQCYEAGVYSLDESGFFEVASDAETLRKASELSGK